MPATVCCPTCWTWSELRKSATCKKCGTPLVLADGRRVEEVAPALQYGGPPAPPPITTTAATAFAGGGAAPEPAASGTWEAPPPPGVGAPLYAIQTQRGVDWIAIARWITIAYGALAVVGLLAFALVVRHLTLPIPVGDGTTVERTFDIGPAMVVTAAIVAALFGIFAWLMQFTAARIVLLVLVVIGALNAMARVSGGSSSLVAAYLASLLIDLGFGYVLLMSILSRPRPEY